MSKIDYQALRKAAQLATQGEWVAFISPGKYGTYAVHTPGDNHHGDIVDWPGFDEQKNAENNARYIAAFNPEVVQALLDERERNQQYIKSRDQENEEIALTVGKLRVELEAAKKRIAELEKSEEQLINERDHAESALADMYFAATGDRPEWSNWFGFSDAVDAVVDRIADLEAKQCIEEMSKQSCEARERDLFESWVMHSICISKPTLEGLRTETGYRNATLSGTDFNRMWEQWKSIRAAGIRINGGE
ncbi:TPA: ead/Ea22-like family protein [Escherichia coli]|nr:ead/Ea22-like family protein [Escherichia coli]